MLRLPLDNFASGSIIRFAKWQIASRLISGVIVHDWVNESKFLVRNGETGLTGNIYTGLHEFSDMAFLLHFLRDQDLFINVGANAGSYTILAGSVVGANVYAFEPAPSTYQRLIDNISLNHLEAKVNPVNMAIGSQTGYIEFTQDLDTVNHVLAKDEKHERAISVELSTLDLVLKDESPVLIKIDVEGYETPVLQGALETLMKPSLQSVIMELNGSGRRYQLDESLILQMLFDCGFKTYSYDPFNRNLINLQGKNLNSGNTLFVRDERYAFEKIKTSPKFIVHGREI